jgi:hypothetical protein
MDTTTVGLIIALAALSVVILAAAIYFTREPPHKPTTRKQPRAKRASRSKKAKTRKPETEK